MKRTFGQLGVILSFILVMQLVTGGLALTGAKKVEASSFQASGIIWIAGDSMAADHSSTADQYKVPLCGWGVPFGQYFTKDVTVHNMAIGGTSSKSFTEKDNYKQIMKSIGAGDYLFIQFGHNDTKADRATNPYGASDEEGSFKYYIKNYYIEPALKAGAKPIIMSSVVKYQFNGNTLRSDQTHRPFAVAMRELAEEYKEAGIDIGFIDMYDVTESLYNAIGPSEAIKYHGVELDGTENSTHYCADGAAKIADIIVKNLYLMDTDINRFILQQPTDGGDGTKENPFLISNSMQLFAAMEGENNKPDTYFEITDNLLPIIQKRDKEVNFYGILDGKNHTLSNMVCFGKDVLIHNNYGELKNCLLSYQLTAQETALEQCLFVRNNYGTITGCKLTGNMNIMHNTDDCRKSYTYGGLAAYNNENAVVSDCAVLLNVSVRTNCSEVVAGGVCGDNKGSILNCNNTGRVGIYIEGDDLVERSVCIAGGIVGTGNEGAAVVGCSANASRVTAATYAVCFEKAVLTGEIEGGTRSEIDSHVEVMSNNSIVEESPVLTGVYGMRAGDMELTGGSVMAGNYTVPGQWVITDTEEKQNEIPEVDTKNKYIVMFQPDDSVHFQPIEKELAPDVLPKPITVVIDSFLKIQGRDNPELSCQIQDSLVGDDTKEDLNIKLSTKATKDSEVGSYKITGKSDNPNYEIHFETGYVKIVSSLQGDANMDEILDLQDAQLVLKAALKITEYDEIFLEKNDLNSNGNIDMEDTFILLKKVLKVV